MKQIIKIGEKIKLKNQWNLEFEISNMNQNRVLFTKNKVTVLDIISVDGLLLISIKYDSNAIPLLLKGNINLGDKVNFVNLDYKIGLYINDVLFDEEWPYGKTELDGAECILCDFDVSINDLKFEEKTCAQDVLSEFRNAQGWKPSGYNVHVGDCMPFYHDGTYHLFYLFDRRNHKSKWGKGAHQWAHISSNDLITWKEHPFAVQIDQQEEGSICTGSVVYYKGFYYAFYAVRMTNGSPAQITWSKSKDGIHFEKSGENFKLTEPYEPCSARDPKVFTADDGLFHMLVTTSIMTSNGYRGALAHVVSEDLKHWNQLDPMIVLDIEDQPECSDYFYKNGYYYLIYSNFIVAHYFYSKSPVGPWIRPENNVVVGDEYQVPKMALWKDERIIFAGFKRIKGKGYGGTVKFYEAEQQDDGTLKFIDVKEMIGD